MTTMGFAPVPEAAWRAKGRELFGDDTEAWVFVCPVCGTEASIARAKTEWPELRGRGWSVYQECVGRYLTVARAPRMKHHPEQPCDWAAYGLFRGPVFVASDEGTVVPCFDFRGLPYTARSE